MKTIKVLMILFCALYVQNVVKAQYWKIAGNGGTNPSADFLGTTDSVSFTIKVNNKKSGYIDCDYTKANTSFGYLGLSSNKYSYNTAFGYKAMLSDTTGGYNTAVGHTSLYFNTVGNFNTAVGITSLYHNISGNSNTAVGGQVLYYNTTGIYNTAIGMNSLFNNTSGNYNTAAGINALTNNTTGNSNTAIGIDALLYNKTGYSNVAVGVEALSKNISGHNLIALGDSALYNFTTDSGGISYNTAIGSKALYTTTNGLLNTATGFQTLYLNTSGDGNSAFGSYALNKNKTGNNNTAVGYNAGPIVSKGGFSNTTALGYNAAPTASNQVRIGNGSVSSIGGQVGWTTFSDARIKNNIKDNVPGLSFINLLRPVTYYYSIKAENELLGIKNNEANAEIEKINFTGLLAQEVENAAQKIKYNFSGVDKSGNIMGLRYSDFITPIIKSVQELSNQNDELKKENEKIKSDLQKQIDELKSMIISGQSSTYNQRSVILTSATVKQNIPNPFTNTTTINYSLPHSYTSAKIIITDKNGRILKETNISGGNGSLKVDASTLAGGAYQYSLYVNNTLVDTKQMVIGK